MIELTPQQRQAIDQGEAVRVVDSATKNAYMIVRAEMYARKAGGLNQPVPDVVPPVPPTPLPPSEQPERIRLRDLPTPPAIAAEAERYRKRFGGRMQDIEDRLKLHYYYGGQTVYGVRTSEGLVVVPIPDRFKNRPDLRYILLTPAERASACLEVLSPWNDTTSEILI